MNVNNDYKPALKFWCAVVAIYIVVAWVLA